MAVLKSPADCALTASARCDSKSLCSVDWGPITSAAENCTQHRHRIRKSMILHCLVQEPRHTCLRKADGCKLERVCRMRVIAILLCPLHMQIGAVSIIGYGKCCNMICG